MRLGIIFGSDDANLESVVGLRKMGLIPADVRDLISSKNLNLTYVGHVDTKIFDKGESIFAKISQASNFCEHILFIFCGSFDHYVEPYKDIAFTFRCDFSVAARNITNFLRSNLSKAIKKFAHLVDRFGNLGTRKLMLLPFDAFDCAYLSELRRTAREPSEHTDFSQRIDQALRGIRDRQRPKSDGSFKTQYIVDDQGRFFVYGFERHGGPETQMPPHRRTCDLGGSYRFGCEFDRDRHFNVSLDGEENLIAGEFCNCHGDVVIARSTTHLNIFPNGFL